MEDNETLESKVEDLQDELEKTRTQLEVQQQEIISKSTEELVETQVNIIWKGIRMRKGKD